MRKLVKIQAFTLTEMLLVLAISTVVAGLAFSIISLFGRNIQAIQSNYAHTTEIRLFEEQLTVDFNRFQTIVFDKDTETLKLKTPLDSVQYTFDLDHIRRGEDTLIQGPHSKTLFRQGKTVSGGILDAVKIEWGEDRNPLFFYRENDAFHYMNAHGN